jgi:hypothetical protein
VLSYAFETKVSSVNTYATKKFMKDISAYILKLSYHIQHFFQDQSQPHQISFSQQKSSSVLELQNQQKQHLFSIVPQSPKKIKTITNVVEDLSEKEEGKSRLGFLVF